MSRSLMMIALVVSGVAVSVMATEDDSISTKIRSAKESYEKESAKLREGVLKSFNKAEEAARKSGNKALVDKIKDESEAFAAKGTIPSTVSTRDYYRKVRKARKTLEDVYVLSIKSLTKSAQLDEAGTIEKELGEFQIAAKIFQGKNFALIKERLSWHEAKLACEKLGGHLAIIRSQPEARFVAQLLKTEGANTAFIGATDEAKEGTWLWIDGTTLAYDNWDREHGQPNNSDGQRQPEHYAAILRERDGKWWDVPARVGALEGFICQWD